MPHPARTAIAAALALGPGPALAGQEQPPQPGGAAAGEETQTFRSRRNLFQLDLPPDWRQLAPGEVEALQQSVPDLPRDVTRVEPALFYTVGPVDRWHRGDFDGVYLYVVVQPDEWVLDERMVERLSEMWAARGRAEGARYELGPVQRTGVGPAGHEAVVCIRTTVPLAGGATADGPPSIEPARPQKSLDVHAPTGGREVTLSFTCWADDFERRLPSFRRALATLTFARPAHGAASLGDRLWTPVITGLLVGGLLLLLYRHTRARQ